MDWDRSGGRFLRGLTGQRECGWVEFAGDDLPGDVGQAQVVPSGVSTEQGEGVVHLELRTLGDHALGLLDGDSAVQSACNCSLMTSPRWMARSLQVAMVALGQGLDQRGAASGSGPVRGGTGSERRGLRASRKERHARPERPARSTAEAERGHVDLARRVGTRTGFTVR